MYINASLTISALTNHRSARSSLESVRMTPQTQAVPVTASAHDADDLLLERQLCFVLPAASRSIVAAYRPVLSELNLTHPQYLVMLTLWEESPRSVKELSTALLLEPATISPLVKRLETAGLITRHRVRGNERVLAVDLSEAGAALRQKALRVPSTMAARLGLDHQDAAELHVMMQRLIASAQRAVDHDVAPGSLADAGR